MSWERYAEGAGRPDRVRSSAGSGLRRAAWLSFAVWPRGALLGDDFDVLLERLGRGDIDPVGPGACR